MRVQQVQDSNGFFSLFENSFDRVRYQTLPTNYTIDLEPLLMLPLFGIVPPPPSLGRHRKVLDPRSAVKDAEKLASDSVKGDLKKLEKYQTATKELTEMLVSLVYFILCMRVDVRIPADILVCVFYACVYVLVFECCLGFVRFLLFFEIKH